MLRARVFTALGLLVGFLAVLFALPPIGTAVAFAVVAALAGWEWAGLMSLKPNARVAYACFVLLSCLLLHFKPEFAAGIVLPLAVLFWLLIAPPWLYRNWRLMGNLWAGYAVGWILVVPAWVAMVFLHGRSPWLLLAVMAMAWVADIAAFFAGRRFGRHKLAPAISPGKTWEGAAGAVVGVLGYGGLALLAAGVTVSSLGLLVVGLVLLTALSIVGDLFESLIKRQAGVKDSGSLLPGHGGILDRIDSQTSTLPLAAVIIYWLAK